MNSSQSGRNDNGYRPTSLDFINRPNPVEPSNVSSRSSLTNDNRQLGRSTDEELLRVLLGPRTRDSATESTRNVKYGGQQQAPAHSLASVLNDESEPSRPQPHSLATQPKDNGFTLPELPVKRGVKRPRNRVPPVLQGLHQPPPNAGLLPSISITESHGRSSTSADQCSSTSGRQHPPRSTDSLTIPVTKDDSAQKTVLKRNPWTDVETNVLLQGVERFGVGNWKQILNCEDLNFNKRNTVDLKDRFRLWTRHQTKLKQASITAAPSSGNLTAATEAPPVQETLRQDLAHLDRHEPREFAASKRRRRNKWTEEQDAALEKGFDRYGNSWTSIVADPILNQRTATDLRDRFRIRFPTKYKEKGLAPKHPRLTIRPEEPSALPDVSLSTSQRPSDQSNTALLSVLDDTWLTDLHLTSEDDEANPIVLDRSIVDWANRQLPSLPSILAGPGDNNNYNLQGIDPRATLLPRPPI